MKKNVVSKISDFLSHNSFFGSGVKALFDFEYYSKMNPEVGSSASEMWTHYISIGNKEGRFPNPLFDPIYYGNNYMEESNEDPLNHYHSNKDKMCNPHPLFEAKYYANQLKSIPSKETLLEHFLKVGYKEKISPTPHFDFEFYLNSHNDVKTNDLNPLIHYLRHGEEEGRMPNKSFIPYALSKPEKTETEGIHAYECKSKLYYKAHKQLLLSSHNDNFKKQLAGLDKSRPTIVCMTHEASRTGAPLIILRIAEQMKNYLGCNVISIIGFHGDLDRDFEMVGPTYKFTNWNPGGPAETMEECENLVSLIKQVDPLGIYINSAESRCITKHFKNQDIPIISLIHEMGFVYPHLTYKAISEFSDRVVFPSKVVHNFADENYHFPIDKVHIRGQGLLKPELLEVSRAEQKVKLREMLNLPSDAFIVLGCGTLTRRKAPEFFVNTAFQVLKRGLDNVYFIWLGGEHSMVPTDLYWMYRDIKVKGYQDKIIFVGQKADSVPYFAGSNVFFMTSRADPFPCVIHEAMAVEIPILGFEDAGGFSEALEDDCGELVPYADIVSAADKISYYFEKPEYGERLGRNARQKVLKQYNYIDYTNFLAKEMITINKEKGIEHNRLNIFEEKSNSLSSSSKKKIEPKKTKKIVFSLASWEVSGVNTFVENLVKGLNSLNYDASILFTSNHHKYLSSKYMPNVPYSFLGAESSEFSKIWHLLTEYLNSNNSPITYFPNHDYVASSICAKLNNNVSTIGVLHSDDVEHYEHAYRLGLYWNKIVSVSKTIENKLLEINPNFKDRSNVIYYGIDSPKERPLPQKKNKLSLVYTGRIVEYQKRIFDFVPIVEKLSKAGVNFELLFIGEGSATDALKSKLQKYVDKKVVKFLGRVPIKKVFAKLEKSHAFVLTSDFEGLPLSLLEALSFHCVPILTDIKSGVGEVIKHGENGLISPIGDSDTFVENILKIEKDETYRKKLALAAFNTLEKYKLRKEDMSEQYAELIERASYEIENGIYVRPKPLTFNSPAGELLLPPMLQKIPQGYGPDGTII